MLEFCSEKNMTSFLSNFIVCGSFAAGSGIL